MKYWAERQTRLTRGPFLLTDFWSDFKIGLRVDFCCVVGVVVATINRELTGFVVEEEWISFDWLLNCVSTNHSIK